MAWLQNTVILALKSIFLLQLIVKLPKILVVVCNNIIFKSMETDFLGMTTMASKEEITVFHKKFREFNSSFGKMLQKNYFHTFVTSILR